MLCLIVMQRMLILQINYLPTDALLVGSHDSLTLWVLSQDGRTSWMRRWRLK
jgi:hypothetical protein